MSKKKHPEHVNHERWLVSYADFITLLFAFFVVLFASGQSDKKKQSRLAVVMQSAFTPLGTFDAHSATPALESGGGTSSNTTPVPIMPPIPTVQDISAHASESVFDNQLQAAIQTETRTAAQINATLKAMLDGQASNKTKTKSSSKNNEIHLPPGSVTVHTSAQGLVISLHEAGIFPSASAEVNPASIPALRKLVATLPPGPFLIEGHTDNIPIHTAQFVSNWELSTARASAIARFLLQNTLVPPADLSAAGYAEFHPITSNATEAGRAQNRRVDIILLRPNNTAHTPASK